MSFFTTAFTQDFKAFAVFIVKFSIKIDAEKRVLGFEANTLKSVL